MSHLRKLWPKCDAHLAPMMSFFARSIPAMTLTLSTLVSCCKRSKRQISLNHGKSKIYNPIIPVPLIILMKELIEICFQGVSPWQVKFTQDPQIFISRFFSLSLVLVNKVPLAMVLFKCGLTVIRNSFFSLLWKLYHVWFHICSKSVKR